MMKQDEIEIATQIMFLYWAVDRIPPLHPSDGQNCDIGLEIRVLWSTLKYSETEIRNRLKFLERAVKSTLPAVPEGVNINEWRIVKEIKTLKWVLREGAPPPFF